MRDFFRIICLLILTYTFTSCSKEYEIPQNLVIHDFVWKGLNAYYLHQDEITDLADTRFNSDKNLNTYLTTFTDYNTLFSSLLIPSDIKSNLIEDYNIIVDPELRTSFTTGLEFGLIKEQDSDTVVGYVLDILPFSYASTQAISRGDYFSAIVNIDNDTLNLTKENYEDLLLNYNQDTLKLVMVDYDGKDVALKSKKTELVKKNYTHNPMRLENTFLSDGNTIGYLMYHNDFSKNYINNLNNTFLNFKNKQVSELILDLRYNIGGGSFAKNISQISIPLRNKNMKENFQLYSFLCKDRDRLIKYLNKSAKQRFGENLIDKNISSVVRDTKLLETIEEAIKDQTTKNVNVEINLPSYQLYKIYIIPGPTHLFPETDSVVLFLKDFTEITKAQKLKTDFVANVSHELRTPLVSIKGSLETILGPASDDKVAQKKFMSIMSEQVLRMENLINDLLILSRIELEEHIKPNKIVNLNDIFTNIKSNFELILKKKKINLQIELMETTLVFGDNDKLLTVFSNLIDNAIKYSQDGKNIYIKSQNSEGKLIGKNMLINIKDEGIGIPQDLIPRITERFFRVDTEKSKKVGGTGLGLAIMKHIISQHRGDYEILSKVNEGTEIKIYLPTK